MIALYVFLLLLLYIGLFALWFEVWRATHES